MPIIKKDAPIQERNIIMVLYGVPSSGCRYTSNVGTYSRLFGVTAPQR